SKILAPKNNACPTVLIKTHAHRNLDNELWRLPRSRGCKRRTRRRGVSAGRGCGLVYLLVLVILAAALPVVSLCASGHYPARESCAAAERASFAFVCVRSFGPSDLASAR